MIEDAMLFALGFCSAILLALASLPLLWHRARRLTRRRLEALMPMSMDEIAAERDGIKARAAVERVEIEGRLEAASAATARAEVELGRRTVSLAEAERALRALSTVHDATSTDLTATRESLQAASARAEAGEATTRTLQDRLDTADATHRSTMIRLDEADALAGERQATIVALEGRLTQADSDLRERTGALEAAHLEQARLRMVADDTVRERDTARIDLLRTIEQRTMLHRQLKDENRRSEENGVRLLAATEALARLERRNMDLDAERATSVDAMAALKTRFDRLEARLLERTTGHAEADPSSTMLAGLRTELADVSDEAIRLLAPGSPSITVPEPVAIEAGLPEPSKPDVGHPL